MEVLIWIGAALTLLGLAGLVWCIFQAFRIRKTERDEDRLRARLQSLVAYNLGALGVSSLGLMCVIVGIFLT
ncbi:hypothetical protein [Tranquillimonas alkanivorans]|uniref:Uncharacterized protein n=1 Tax=Tranquillimonas alkanivorans TaxID=441119 RepID=A0A1I5SPJ8_9RHOB|nr:hypothetical protein [Tranquillimonas alkanivorans]SFP72714.1 hypothetical protein SAMN04488047_111131 [Tranquillimonas alkanivorans]